MIVLPVLAARLRIQSPVGLSQLPVGFVSPASREVCGADAHARPHCFPGQLEECAALSRHRPGVPTVWWAPRGGAGRLLAFEGLYAWRGTEGSRTGQHAAGEQRGWTVCCAVMFMGDARKGSAPPAALLGPVFLLGDSIFP